MNTTLWIIVAAVVVLVLIVVGLRVLTVRRRTNHLKGRFGPEYERAIEQNGDRRSAEIELETREKRVDNLDIRPLSSEDQQRFSDSWQSVQSEFVDDPSVSVTHADRLVVEVMETRGYPMGNFDQRAADVSASYPEVADNYRSAHDIALRHLQGDASTEDLRKAMIHYRVLFEELLKTPVGEPAQR